MGWIGVDLDGTLAFYYGFVAPTVLGEPIPRMVSQVKELLDVGVEIKIFTARIDPTGLALYKDRTGDPTATPESVTAAIKAWCVKHLGRELEITDRKDLRMIMLWDDQARQVIRNTGNLVIYSYLEKSSDEERSALEKG
jgi:hypothetical protein